MITGTHIRAIRRIIKPFLTDRCTIQRRTLVADGSGGHTITYPAIAQSVPCLMIQARWRPTETVQANKLTGITEWNGAVPATQDIKATDRIIVTTLDSRTFEVVGVVAASLEALREFQATEIL